MNPKKKPYYSPSSSQAGFTLIESLMAILVVTIMMIAISPAIVLSVATRVQTKRLEMGTNAARAYIAAVSSGGILNSNDQKAPPPPISRSATIPNAVDVPTGGTLACTAPSGDYLVPPGPPKFFKCDTQTADSFLYCADNDDDNRCSENSTKDMIVQGFGINQDPNLPTDPEKAADQGYQLGIRVYRADAFKDSDPLKKSTSDPLIKREAKTVTSGLGDRKAPLVEMTTEITTDKTTYSNLCKRLKAFGDDTGNDNSACR